MTVLRPWQLRVLALTEDAEPVWTTSHDFPGPMPWCVESCRYHDGKRCVILGQRPDRLCVPVVSAMAEMLATSDGEP